MLTIPEPKIKDGRLHVACQGISYISKYHQNSILLAHIANEKPFLFYVTKIMLIRNEQKIVYFGISEDREFDPDCLSFIEEGCLYPFTHSISGERLDLFNKRIKELLPC